LLTPVSSTSGSLSEHHQVKQLRCLQWNCSKDCWTE